MIALLLTVWAALLFRRVAHDEAVGLDGTQAHHDRDERGELLAKWSWRLAQGAAVLLVVGLVLHVVAEAAADGADAALLLCADLDVSGADGETARRCLAYADTAAHGSTLADVGEALVWLALAL